jgi:phosphoglucomutase
MRTTDIFSGPKRCDFDEAAASGLVTFLGAETDEAFLENVMAQSIDPEAVRAVADRFPVVYTPFHGTGYRLVPEALRRLGLTRLYPVPEQMAIDGSFPTVKSPNPENPEGFRLGIELARKVGSELIIGTDPDADRVGVLVRRGEDFVPITGNQMGVLLLDYIIRTRRAMGTLPENAAVIKTIVSTTMAREVAERNGVHTDETFTGFKYMAKKLGEYEKAGSYSYLLAFEESYGYMMGDYVRDKDGVTASMLITEMAASYFRQGMSLLDAMDALYARYGWFGEQTLNLVMPAGRTGKNGRAHAQAAENPPSEIGGEPVLKQRDYLTGEIRISGLASWTRQRSAAAMCCTLSWPTARSLSCALRHRTQAQGISAGAGRGRHDRDDKLRRYAAFAEEELGK